MNLKNDFFAYKYGWRSIFNILKFEIKMQRAQFSPM